MRIGLLGGTFDPVHVGHLTVARAARRGLALDRVLLVPVHVPPHKPAGPTLAGDVRADLIARAVEDDPHLSSRASNSTVPARATASTRSVGCAPPIRTRTCGS